jgi:hypothetical protein
MSLFPIGAQPIDFGNNPSFADCEDVQPPLLMDTTDTLLFQLGIGCCDENPLITEPDFRTGWLTAGRWTVVQGQAFSTDGAQQASIEWPNLTPTPGDIYCISIDFSEVGGAGVIVRFGGGEWAVGQGGVWSVTHVATDTNVLSIQLVQAGSNVTMASAQVFEGPDDIEVELFDCEGDTVLFTATLNTTPQYFQIFEDVLLVNIPMEDTGITDGCFRVRALFDCAYGDAPIESTTVIKVDTAQCRGTIKLRVCNDAPKMGVAPGYFEQRIAASLVRPRWNIDLQEQRQSDGRIVRTYADRTTTWELWVEPVGYSHHQFLSSLPLWDHLYLQGVEWAAQGAEYTPDYTGRTTVGGITLELRPRKELLRAVQCATIGEGCDPANDPICSPLNFVVGGPDIIGDEPFVRLVIFDELGFIPGNFEWRLDGVLQTPVTYTGPGTYLFGPAYPGSLVVITVEDTAKPGCFENVQWRQPLPDQSFTFDVVGDASGGDFTNIVTTSGYWVIRNYTGYFEIVQDGDNAPNIATLDGLYLVYASDVNGNPSGVITDILVFDVPMEPVDFSTLFGILSFGWQVDTTTAPTLSGSQVLTNYDVDNNNLSGPPDLTSYPALTQFNANGCGLVLAPSFVFNPLIGTVAMAVNALPASEINRVLFEINAHGTSNGTIILNGGTSAAPDTTSGGFDGVAARNALISRGWMVAVN